MPQIALISDYTVKPVIGNETQRNIVSPIAIVFISIGAVLFLATSPLDPLAFFINACIWALFFWFPGLVFYRSMMRSGVTVMALLFFVATGFHAEDKFAFSRIFKNNKKIIPTKKTRANASK